MCLLDQCCNSSSNTTKPHRVAVPIGQPHLDLVLADHSRQPMQAELTSKHAYSLVPDAIKLPVPEMFSSEYDIEAVHSLINACKTYF